MVQAMRAFLEFYYIARRDVHDTHSLKALEDTLQQFHHHREIFRTSGVHADGFNLSRQHSLIHYIKLIWAYGAPNGLCSSITESKHIKAMKEPWRRSIRCSLRTSTSISLQLLVLILLSTVCWRAHVYRRFGNESIVCFLIIC